MIIKHIEGSTRILNVQPDWNGADPNSCGALPIRDIATNQGNFMVSAWELTPVEIAALIGGATLKLWIRGEGHPVVCLTVGDIPTEDIL